MKLKQIKLTQFKRFHDLCINNIGPAKLILMAGPNGCGKSSLFDAFNVWRRGYGGFGLSDPSYYNRNSGDAFRLGHVELNFHEEITLNRTTARQSFHVRSAYRNDASFKLNSMSRLPDAKDELHLERMIDTDARVNKNYQRLVSASIKGIWGGFRDSMSIQAYRESIITEIRDPIARLFPRLVLTDIGDPLSNGTFRFKKGAITTFEYENLSGGEKAAFDIVLDIAVIKTEFYDTIYCIDEPELHLNSRLQAGLLQEIYDLVPENCQLWIATHSIGMMRKALELYRDNSSNVIFIDFDGHDFDFPAVLEPVRPTRIFWERNLAVAMDDLSKLVAPSRIIICEGEPDAGVAHKNPDHDAACYNAIFEEEFPDTKFLSAGNCNQVASDRLGIVAALPKIVPGVEVYQIIDRDDHTPSDVTELNKQGIRVLTKRNLEAYLFDDEVIGAYCRNQGHAELVSQILAEKTNYLHDSISRGNPPDDLKAIAGFIYTSIKRTLSLSGIGNDWKAFARNHLAHTIKPGMSVYDQLKADIFGVAA